MQLLCHDAGNAWSRAGIAPAVSAAIVKTNSGEVGYLGLNEVPIDIRTLVPIFQDDGWAATACATQVETIAADVDQFARRMIEPKVAIVSVPLVKEAGEG